MAALSSSDGPLGEFAVAVGFANTSAVLGIRGGVDRLSARELAAILDTVIERHQSVVLDLTKLAFMNSWGLEVIATPSVAPQGIGQNAHRSRTLSSACPHARAQG
jgi:anti-anti-sigma factor